MPRNPSRRVQVGPLEDPQGLKVPNAVAIPAQRPQVNAAGSELMQLSAALEDLNPSLSRLGVALFQKSQQEGEEAGQVWAATNPEEAKAAAQLPWKEAVKQGLLPEGANPYFVTAARQQYGQQQALTAYETMLRESKSDITNPLNPVDIDEAIGEKRKAFLESLGDNFYARQGAARVLQAVENDFRNKAITERTAAVEALGRTQASSNGMKYAEQWINALSDKDLKGAEEAKAQVVAHINELEGIFKDAKKFYVENIIQSFALDMALVDRNKTLRYLDAMRELALNDNGAKFGGSGEINIALRDIEDRVNRIADREEGRARVQKDQVRAEVFTKANDAIYNLVEDARSSGKPLDDATLQENLTKLTKLFQDYPDYLGTIKNSFREIYTKARDTRSVSNQKVVGSIGQLILDGKFNDAKESIDANVELGNLSPADALRFNEDIAKEQDISRHLNSNEVTRAYGVINALIKVDESTANSQEVGAELYQEFTSELTEQLREGYARARAEGGTRQEFEARLAPITAKALKDTKEKLKVRLKEMSAEAKRRDEASTPQSVLTRVTPKLMEQANAVAALANNVGNLDPTKLDSARKIVAEHAGMLRRDMAEVVGSLRAGGRRIQPPQFGGGGGAGINPSTASTFIPFDKAQKEQQLETYYQLKGLQGYQPAEILRGVTDDGLPVDTSKINPYFTALYPNTDALKRSYEQFLDGDQTGVFGQYLKLFKIDATKKDDVNFFLDHQTRLTIIR